MYSLILAVAFGFGIGSARSKLSSEKEVCSWGHLSGGEYNEMLCWDLAPVRFSWLLSLKRTVLRTELGLALIKRQIKAVSICLRKESVFVTTTIVVRTMY